MEGESVGVGEAFAIGLQIRKEIRARTVAPFRERPDLSPAFDQIKALAEGDEL